MEQGDLPYRSKPAHHPAVERHNQSLVYFITVCTKDRRPILANSEAHVVLKNAWQAASSFLVGRYVIMPDHLHLFCSPADVPPLPLDQWVKFWPDPSISKLWQRNFWDTQLRTGDSYSEKWEYVRHNPVRAGIAAESSYWRFRGEMHPLRWND